MPGQALPSRVRNPLPRGKQVAGEDRFNEFVKFHKQNPKDHRTRTMPCQSGGVARTSPLSTRSLQPYLALSKAVAGRRRGQSHRAKQQASSQAIALWSPLEPEESQTRI